ncbi:MAG: hypothetical protein MJ227_00875 [Bacilli bacterium]|nr:hypothetical protein [Bacilli bacterium]
MGIVRHFTLENINLCKKQDPIVLFYSSTGAMGPSGLILVMLENEDIYVANACRYKEKGYKEIVDSLFKEFPLLNCISMPLVKGKIKIPSSHEYIYLGYGNGAIINKGIINKYKIKDFRSFFGFINKIAKTDVEKVAYAQIELIEGL